MSLQTRNALWAGLPRPKFDDDHVLHLPGYDQHQSKQILARMLARSMGGEVTVGDRSGGGCMVMVELPQRRSDDDGSDLGTESAH